MKALFLVLVCCLFSNLANASQVPYIELAQPGNMMEVHVNSSLFNPNNGVVTKTEISFGDGTVVTNKPDSYHQYNLAGSYNIVVKTWTVLGSVQTFTKSIELNPQYRIFSIASSTVFSNSVANNRNYTFQLSSAQAEKLYKIKLTRRSNTPEMTSIVAALHGNCALNLNVVANSIPVFKNHEIDCNTISIEKLVRLKTSNEIVYDEPLLQQSRKLFSTEISAVELVKDYTTPVIASSLTSGTLTKVNKTHISITDESIVTTYVWDQSQNLLFTTDQKSFDISLNEGANNFVIQSKDQYNNTSGYYYLTNITRDSAPASLNTILNSEYIYSSYPQNFTLTIYSDEDLQYLSVNGILALLTAPRTYTYVLNVSQPGTTNIVLHGIDLAGNESFKTYSPIFSIDTIPPTITTNLPSNVITSQNSVHISIVDNAGTVTDVFKNGQLIKSTDLKEFDVAFDQQGFASYVIKSRDAFNNEAEDIHFDVTFDSVPPQTTSLTPEEGKSFPTNHLPFNIPVTVEFNEEVSVVTVNSTSATMITPTKSTVDVPVLAAGPTVLLVEAKDAAGNPTVIERTVIIEYSNTPPVLTLDASVRNALTNQIEFTVFGTSNVKLSNAKLNGVDISVSADGLSFSGIFPAPADGRYQFQVAGTDRFGNSGSVTGHVRILVDLPDVFKNYAPLALIPTKLGSRIDFGPGFSGPNTGDYCAKLKHIFEEKEEFSANLQNLQKREDDILSQFPDGYAPDVPTTESLQRFIGQIDEPLNYVKAGYLAVCEHKIVLPETDCPKNREIMKLLTGQYPEPMLIRMLPIAPFIQDFLISRYNICTGLDTSGLSCEDMKRLLPLVADLAFPSVGTMLASPVGQFVMDALMCKEICELPEFKETPACKNIGIPEIPQLDVPTDISTSIPNPDFPGVDFGSDDWGGGGGGPHGGHGHGGGGGSCGGLFKRRCGNGGGGRFPRFSCAEFPTMPRCLAGLGSPFDEMELDTEVECPTAGWKFSDIFSSSSPISHLSSIIAKCSDTVPSNFPQIKGPVITVVEPVMNQAVSDTVRVSGYVNDMFAEVSVNGQQVYTLPGEHGGHFSVIIPVPTSNTVTVESANTWGIPAEPVVIHLETTSVGDSMDISVGVTQSCLLTEDHSVKCWGSGYLGDGQYSQSEEPVQAVGLESDVTSISVGHLYACAIKSKSLYCWGYNQFGQLGDGTTEDKLVPTLIPGFEGNVVSVAAGFFQACATKIDGSTWCWGRNLLNYSPLGRSNLEVDQVYPFPELVESLGAGSGVKSLYRGLVNTCALRTSGVTCWGGNVGWQLGHGVYFGGDLAQNIPGLESNVTKIATGFHSTCAIQNGGVVCWGSNLMGGLGIGTTDGEDTGAIDDTPPPHPLAALPLLSSGVTDIASIQFGGGRHSHCAIKDGKVYCWGDRFGNEPTYVDIDNATKISMGAFKICALSNKQVVCIDP